MNIYDDRIIIIRLQTIFKPVRDVRSLEISVIFLFRLYFSLERTLNVISLLPLLIRYFVTFPIHHSILYIYVWVAFLVRSCFRLIIEYTFPSTESGLLLLVGVAGIHWNSLACPVVLQTLVLLADFRWFHNPSNIAKPQTSQRSIHLYPLRTIQKINSHSNSYK